MGMGGGATAPPSVTWVGMGGGVPAPINKGANSGTCEAGFHVGHPVAQTSVSDVMPFVDKASKGKGPVCWLPIAI